MPRKAVSERKPGHFISIQTGPWEGRGSWLYRVRCGPCDFIQLEDSRDAALEVVDDHYKHDAVVTVEADFLEDGETWEEV